MGVCGTSLWAWKDCVITSASLLPQPLSYSLSFIDKSRWRIFTLSQILLYLKKIFAFCSPRDFFSLPTTSLSVSVKSNFSFKFKPELCPEISSSYSGVIFCISCYFAFRETESYLAEFYCSYQGHTAPIIKRAELLPCRTQIWLQKAMACPWLMLTLSWNVNLISLGVRGVLIGDTSECFMWRKLPEILWMRL